MSKEDARMIQSETTPAQPNRATIEAPADILTLIAISCLAYVLAVALHEHAGHSAACALLGSYPKEMGAFYVDCDNAGLSNAGMRLVALAGPVVSLLTGIVCFLILRRVPRPARLGHYFVWLLGSLGLMSAAGYPLFSGVSGMGDLGTTRDGVFYEAVPEWFWRITLTAFGAIAYWWVVKFMWQTMGRQLNASDAVQLRHARRVTLISYVAGGVAYAAIGLLNPYGFIIVAVSVLPSSLGGTCGLLAMWSVVRRYPVPATQNPGPGLNFPRNWTWIGIAAAITLAYAGIFGPTLWQ
jgi:hypothetical protein